MTRYEIGPCPACSSPDQQLVADAADIRAEVEQVWAFHTRRLKGSTPPERLHDRIAFSQKPPLRIVRCGACSLLYRNPRERPDELIDLYADERPDETALQALFDNQAISYRAQARRLSRFAGSAGTGLEIGSYVGAFLSAARDAGWSFAGIDVNATANEFARARGFTVLDGTIDDAVDARYDAVAFWNCFDQLPDPAGAARAARARLSTGGWIAIRVPNGQFYARWRRRLTSPYAPLARALLAHNNLLGFPYRHGFSPRSLDLLLDRAGFRVRHVVGDALVSVADRCTRPWARIEEAAIKTTLRSLPAAHSPWVEVYAQAI